MNPFFLFSIAASLLALPTASLGCTSEPYEMAASETRSFLVEGPDPQVEQDSGEATVTSSYAVRLDLTLLTLECSAGGPCTGTVRGC